MAAEADKKKSSAAAAPQPEQRKRGARAKREGGGRMPRLLQTLLEEHRYIDQTLRVLEDQAAKIEAGQEADFSLILDVLRYLSQAPNQFHHPREDELFEYLRERDPSLNDFIDNAMAEHRHLEQEGDALAALLKEVHGTRNEETIKQISQRMTDYISVLRHHVDGEEATLFGRALDVLSDSEWKQLWKRMPAQEDPLFGAKPDEAYALVSHYLQHRWGRAVSKWAQREYVGVGAMVGTLGAFASGATDLGRIMKERTSHAVAASIGVWQPLWKEKPTSVRPYISASVDTAINAMEALAGGLKDAGQALHRARVHTEEAMEPLELADDKPTAKRKKS